MKPDVTIYTINVNVVRCIAILKKCRGDDIFTISMKDILEHQEKEKYKDDIDPATILPREYHEFLDVFEKRPPGLPPKRG